MKWNQYAIFDEVCQAMVNSGHKNAVLKIIFFGRPIKDIDVFEECLLSKFQELEFMLVSRHHPFLEIRVKNN